MGVVYRKSQTGWVVITIFGSVSIFLFLAFVNQWGSKPLPLTPFLVLELFFVGLGFLFYKLTVELGESTLRLTYGIGLIRITFEMDQLLETEIISTPWYYGLGIRITPKGMLYNIQGSKAIKIDYMRKDKKKSVMVGTPEPGRLKKALEDSSREQG
ncbi:hypothetical protein SAMN04488057_101487 [Cyclobacterium lianum]|uniref:Uncharacterized protein n=1 Tax=Cyclobacterium lianum TaxID=388280 RepID=A0A1M7IW13_9BACT|nr:hypothetical protein SAMN04488057_101487 [Cyclobacterium lianum]